MVTVAGVQTTFSSAHGYDSVGRLTSIGYPNGQTANYAYSTGQPSAMTVTIGGLTSNVLTGLSYEPFGPVSGWTYGNGLTRTKSYDLDRRLTSLATKNGATSLQSLSYAYNTNDLITQITNGVDATQNQGSGYDELSRLSSLTTPGGGTQGYVYDANGNRMTDTISSTSNRMTGSNALGATTFGYDPMGNMTSYNISGFSPVTYAYDAFNRMQTATFGGTIGTYGYNAYNERTSKVAAQGTFRYIYGEDKRLLAERRDGTNAWTNYLWFGSELVGISRGTPLYSLHTDHLGRPELATDAFRSVVWRSNNSAFGHRTIVQDSIGGLNVGFPGQYFDAETGFWYNMNRYYISEYGRYSQSDPIGLAGGINPYMYVRENPVNLIDRDGKNALLVLAVPVIGGAIAGGAGAFFGTLIFANGTLGQAFASIPAGAIGGMAAVATAALVGVTTASVVAGVVLDVSFTAALDIMDVGNALAPPPVVAPTSAADCPAK